MLQAEILTLHHWLSPAFPTGAFAYSHGLEQVIALGQVTEAAGLEYWLADVLRYGSGWQDCVLLACALREGANLDALDATCHALQPCLERLQETQEQGAAFARTVAQITGRDLAVRALPIAVAEAAAPLGLPAQTVIAAYLHAFLTNLVTIGIRHVPLGQGEGHGVLARLLPLVPELAHAASLARLEDLGNCCLGADMAAMEHETKDIRLFRT